MDRVEPLLTKDMMTSSTILSKGAKKNLLFNSQLTDLKLKKALGHGQQAAQFKSTDFASKGMYRESSRNKETHSAVSTALRQ